MSSATTEERLKQVVAEAVNEAFEKQKASLQAAMMEAIEDIGLMRAMEEADSELSTPEEIDQLLGRRGES